jgi:hypothetical protein
MRELFASRGSDIRHNDKQRLASKKLQCYESCDRAGNAVASRIATQRRDIA